MRFSIIIPVWNNLSFTIPCIQSIFAHTKEFELILVDNGSTDDTPAYLQALTLKHPNVKISTFPENRGFSKACNAGAAQAQGDYLIFLNNDTLVTPGWAEQMVAAIPLAEKEFDYSPVGIIGPRTNYAGGGQSIPTDPYLYDQLNQAAIEHHQHHQNEVTLTGFCSGFCMLITRPCWEDLGGFDERYQTGGVEDVDLCLTAQLKGWKLAWDNSTFIHHHGGKTLEILSTPYAPTHAANRLAFIEKHYHDQPRKLVCIMGVKDQLDRLKQSLPRNAKFADEIIVLCHQTTEYNPQDLKKFPKVTTVLEAHGDWDLPQHITLLSETAQNHNADWIIYLDADEILEDSFTYDYAHQLMNPLDPNILAYSFPFCTFFLGTTHYRADGIFGRMRGIRMWKSLPNQHPRKVPGNPIYTLHCPAIAPFNIRNLRTRIKHCGYESPEICQKKYAFYTSIDPNPSKTYIGPEGYAHLISPTLTLQEWKEKNDLALCMVVRNEEINLFNLLYSCYPYFDQIVIVDTGSKDHTQEIAQTFGANVYTFPWRKDFAAARNFAKSKCTTSWILSLDPDEEMDTDRFPQLFQMLEENVDAYLFKVLNFRKDHTINYSDNTRLLRNIPELYWTGRVHEKIAPAVKKHNLKVAMAPITIKHYGYLKDDASQKRKTKMYAQMLRKDLKEHPHEPSHYFHYAFHFLDQGNEQRALQYLNKALELDPNFFLANKELGLIYLTKAAHYFQGLAQTIPREHYFYQWAQQTNQAIQNIANIGVD